MIVGIEYSRFFMPLKFFKDGDSLGLDYAQWRFGDALATADMIVRKAETDDIHIFSVGSFGHFKFLGPASSDFISCEIGGVEQFRFILDKPVLLGPGDTLEVCPGGGNVPIADFTLAKRVTLNLEIRKAA